MCGWSSVKFVYKLKPKPSRSSIVSWLSLVMINYFLIKQLSSFWLKLMVLFFCRHWSCSLQLKMILLDFYFCGWSFMLMTIFPMVYFDDDLGIWFLVAVWLPMAVATSDHHQYNINISIGIDVLPSFTVSADVQVLFFSIEYSFKLSIF